jgi:signal transduction histidine kinase
MAFLRTPEKNWLVVGFGVLTTLLGTSSWISYQNANQLIESSNQSQQTFEIIKSVDDIFTAVTIAESSRRGYVYLESKKELERFYTAIDKIPPNLQKLRQRLTQNPDQLKRLNELDRLVNKRINLMKESIILHKQNGIQSVKQASSVQLAQLMITNRSIALRADIQKIITEIQQQQELELKQSLQVSQVNIQNRKLIEVWLMLSSFMVILICFIALYLQLVKRQEAENLQDKLTQQTEMSELKLRFFSMVSHEFRTPLSIILGSAQLLAQGQPLWEEERKLKNIQRIQSAANVMKHLLTDILMLTRAEAGKLECNPMMLDLESFCLNLVEDLESSNTSNHHILFSSECCYHHADLDERLLYSILSNLLSNAMKYSPEQSKVELVLRCLSDVVIFQVKDEGCGISIEDQPQLYDPFYRGQGATQIAGTGLGLAVVKKCVDLQHGEISIESQPDIGTTFTVKFPRSKS